MKGSKTADEPTAKEPTVPGAQKETISVRAYELYVFNLYGEYESSKNELHREKIPGKKGADFEAAGMNEL